MTVEENGWWREERKEEDKSAGCSGVAGKRRNERANEREESNPCSQLSLDCLLKERIRIHSTRQPMMNVEETCVPLTGCP